MAKKSKRKPKNQTTRKETDLIEVLLTSLSESYWLNCSPVRLIAVITDGLNRLKNHKIIHIQHDIGMFQVMPDTLNGYIVNLQIVPILNDGMSTRVFVQIIPSINITNILDVNLYSILNTFKDLILEAANILNRS